MQHGHQFAAFLLADSPDRWVSLASARRARSRLRQGLHITATVQTSPFADSYHHFCCASVHTCAMPQALQLNGMSM